MSNENFDSDFEEIEELDEIDNIEDEEISTCKSSNRRKNRRRWREIETIKDRKKLASDLETIENYDL